jgi:hypothetical protein
MKINTLHLENIILEETRELLKEFTNDPDPASRDDVAVTDDELLQEDSAETGPIKIETLYSRDTRGKGRKANWWWCKMTLIAGNTELLKAVASNRKKAGAGVRAIRRLARKIVNAATHELLPLLSVEGQPISPSQPMPEDPMVPGPGIDPVPDPSVAAPKKRSVRENIQRIIAEEFNKVLEEAPPEEDL